MLTCPICTGPLAPAPAGNTLVCPRGHTFDVARDGYVNLLVGGVRGDAGDTKEMLHARRSFLERGYYAPLSEQVNATALKHLGDDPARIVLDAGCGEGSYLGRLRTALDAHAGAGRYAYVGVDIAKEAVRLAAKRYPGIHFAVADVKHRIPVADGSVAVLLNIFAPRDPAEFARVVAPGGLLLSAIPGPRHLVELRERYGLLGIEPEKERHIASQLAPTFALLDATPLEYPITLPGEDVRQLLLMTPNARHQERQGWPDVTSEEVHVTASFVLLAFRHIKTA